MLSKKHTEAIFRMTGKLLPVGLPVCKYHYDVAEQYIKMYDERLKQLQGESEGASSSTDNSYYFRECSAVVFFLI